MTSKELLKLNGFMKSCFSFLLLLLSAFALHFVYYLNSFPTGPQLRPGGNTSCPLLSSAGVYVLPTHERLGRIVNFPPLPLSQSWKDLIRDEGLSKQEKLRVLGMAMQEQLEHFQAKTSCAGHTLHCGNIDTCGLACQLHRRAACVIMSYSMGIPLIHDASTQWFSVTPWGKIYKRLGSGCKANEKTIYVKRRKVNHEPPILHMGNCTVPATGNISCPLSQQFEYPILKGLPIPNELYDIIKAVHEDPFFWYVGQFMKYATRYTPELEKELNESDKAIQFQESSPALGIHIRGTDKIWAHKVSGHEVKDYMNFAAKLFETEYPKGYSPRTVYLASDNHTFLDQVKNNYTAPLWKILGMESNGTFQDYEARKSDAALRTILVDLHFLSRCERLVCGWTSNVCRLLLELLATKYPDISKRFQNVDVGYPYQFTMGWRVDPPNYLLPM